MTLTTKSILRCLGLLLLWSIEAVAWRAKKNTPIHQLHISMNNILSIRGGDIQNLQCLEETNEVVFNNSIHDDQLVIIYFTSKNCPPCKRVSPIFEELSEEFEDREVVFCKVDVDDNPDTATTYQVNGWPTLLFFKKGEKVIEIVGGEVAEATLYDWVKLLAPKEEISDGKSEDKGNGNEGDDL
jgi:thioredoxin 1